MKTIEITNIRIEAGDDKYLYNGNTFCKVAYLGVNDSVSNWCEVTEEEKLRIETENVNKEEVDELPIIEDDSNEN